MHHVREYVPQAWAKSNCVPANMITAYHQSHVGWNGKPRNLSHHIYSRNMACRDEHYADDKDKHIFCQFPTSSYQHGLHYQSNHDLLQVPINQPESIIALMVTYEDGLNHKIDSITPAHKIVGEVRIYQGLFVRN